MLRLKIILSCIVLISISYLSCTKDNEELLALMRKVVEQNDSLNNKVQSLQKTTDSINAVLKVTNQNVVGVNAKIDSIRLQLTQLTSQINSINLNLASLGPNYAQIQEELTSLNVKYQELYKLMQELILGLGNSGNLPNVTTVSIRDSLTNNPVVEGLVAQSTTIQVISRGFVWDTIPSPILPNSLNSKNGSGLGSFTQILNGLVSGKKYYVRAYATSTKGTSYGNEISFNYRKSDPFESYMIPYLNFNGSNSYVQIGLTGIFTSSIYGKSFSVEYWIKSEKATNVDQTIIGTGYFWNGGVGSFKMSLLNGRLYAQVGNYSGYALGALFPTDNFWHHVVFQHDNNNRLSKIYIDGVEKGKMSHLGTSHMVPATIGIDGMGANLDAGNVNPNFFFQGSIRKVRVSDGIVYENDFVPSHQYAASTATIAFWEMNEGSGNVIKSNKVLYDGAAYNCTWHK